MKRYVISLTFLLSTAFGAVSQSAFGPPQELLESFDDANVRKRIIEFCDLDNDNDEDIIEILLPVLIPPDFDTTTSKVYWHENLGNGEFSEPIFISSISNTPKFINVGDLNNDQQLDIVISAHTLGDLYMDNPVLHILINIGNQEFNQDTISLGNIYISELISWVNIPLNNFISIHDYNNDSYNDILIAGNDFRNLTNHGNVTLFNSTENGISHTGQIVSNFEGYLNNIIPLDVNSDGELDFVTDINTGDSIKVFAFLSQGNSTFSSKQILSFYVPIVNPFTADSVALVRFSAEDFNNDSYPDILVEYNLFSNTSSSWFNIFLNDQNTNYYPSQEAINFENRISIAHLGSLNKDEYVDVLFQNLAQDSLSLPLLSSYINNGDGSLSSEFTYESYNYHQYLMLSDFDNDSTADIVSTFIRDDLNYDQNGLITLKNSGIGSFDEPNYIDSTFENYIIKTYSIDINSDGYYDIVACYGEHSNRIIWFENIENDTLLTHYEEFNVSRNIDLQIHPNPFHHSTFIRIESLERDLYDVRIFNIQGREVRFIQTKNTYPLELQRGNLASGLYILTLYKANTNIIVGSRMLQIN